MVHKNRELDSQLAGILLPLGFEKIPKTRCFIRLCKEGVLQGVYWHSTRHTAQALQCWINSVLSDPDDLFRNYLTWCDRTAMIGSISCTEFLYTDNEYIPTRVFIEPTEEEQLEYFKSSVLPRLERWQTQSDVFHARRGSEMATAEGYPLFKPRYFLGLDLNLALYLDLPDEVEQYLNEPIFFEQRREDGERERNDLNRSDWRRIASEKWIQKKDFIESASQSAEVDVQQYLRICEQQNLYDYKRLLKGDRGKRRFIIANETGRPFFQIVREREAVPVHWGE